jgi:transaldolase
MIEAAVCSSRQGGLCGDELVDDICDALSVSFGLEILKLIPGRISTEVDACLSFDKHRTLEKARKLIRLYEANGIHRDRVLIKLASTWEGIRACEELEKEGIHTNMTLIFNYHQAIACAQAGATLISPFVGRILDWYNKNTTPAHPYTMLTDPGVKSVTQIYNYLKTHGHNTIVMGASFRSKNQILGLAGIDALTISPKLLEELDTCREPLEKILDSCSIPDRIEAVCIDEPFFRWVMNEDAMATEKLAEGIRNFNKDLTKLKELVRSRI